MNHRPFHAIRWIAAQVFIGLIALTGLLGLLFSPLLLAWWWLS